MPTENAGDNFVPSTLNAGDTWQFTLSFPIYPASAGWTAKWQLSGLNQQYSFAATTNPNLTDFDFLVSALTSAAVPPGEYGYRIIVLGSGLFAGQQFTALPATPISGEGRLTVRPNFGTLPNYDVRSPAELELIALQATILALETNQVKSATFSGQSFTSQDIRELRDREVQLIERIKQQQKLTAIREGRASGNQVQVRFVNT
jgi:hypothetical protein